MIRYNQRFVLYPWTIKIGDNTLMKSNEDFLAFCQNQTGSDNLMFLTELLDTLDDMRDNHHDFCIRNQHAVNQLITCLNRRLLEIGQEDHNLLHNNESSEETPIIPRYRDVFGRWIITHSALDEVD